MKALSLVFAIGLMSLLISEGLGGVCMTACDAQLCNSDCKVKGKFYGTCMVDTNCPSHSPMICDC